MHILKTSFNGNPNIGLYGFCTDRFCLLGLEVKESIVEQVSKVLGVPVYQTNICGTSLLGVFIVGNSNKILVPSIAFESEVEFLRSKGIDVEVIKTKLTALGNNLVANDSGCLANPDFSAESKKRIRTALNVPLKPGTIAGLPTVGSLTALNGEVCLTHPDIDEEEFNKLDSLLQMRIETGTVNMGIPFVRSGLLCNKNGFVIGDKSGGPEMAWIDECMGYLDPESDQSSRPRMSFEKNDSKTSDDKDDDSNEKYEYQKDDEDSYEEFEDN